jgi:peptide subunit release factor 1 (eRF1)
MRGWLGRDLDRSTTRGVALYSCSEQDFFQVVEVPRPVRDHAGLGPTPHVAQLVAVLDAHERCLVALVDHRRLRVLRVELGEVTELPGALDREARAVDTSIELGSFERHTEDVTRAHYRHAAALVERALADWPADRLIVGGPDDGVAGLEAHLPPSIRGKIIGRAGVRASANLREVADAVAGIEDAAERRRQAEVVEELRQRTASGRRGVVGLEATLDSLAQRRAGTLVVSDGFSAPGARCPTCSWRGVDVRRCPSCGSTTVEIDDVVELAVDEAAAQGAKVELCRGTDLDRFGRIGAIERY